MGVCRAMNETRKKEGREGEHIQVFSPIMACIFSPGPSASTFNIPSRAGRASARGSFLRKYCFLLESLRPSSNKQHQREEEKFSLASFTFFMARGKSLRSKSCGKTKSTSRRDRGRRWRSQTFAGARRGRQTYQTPRGAKTGRASLHTHFHTYSPTHFSIRLDCVNIS